MKEYNWRKEREKYRTDFSNEDDKSNQQVVVESVVTTSSTKKYVTISLSVLAVIILVVAGFLIINRDNDPKDSTAMLAEVAEKHKTAVGVVALTIELKNGKKFTDLTGTAWAMSENKFATNAHVAMGLQEGFKSFVVAVCNQKLKSEAEKNNCKTVEEYLKKLGPQAEALIKKNIAEVHALIKDVRADIIINQTRKKSYSIVQVQIHKDYGTVGTKFDPDVAIFTIQGKHDNYFKLAEKETLESLKSGEPIAFLGFPMEFLRAENVNADNPIASMQSGIIVALSDFEMKDAGKSGNLLLRHNLPATGGASGSPIFNKNGEVIALLHAINVVGQVRNGQAQRAPSAVQINFGVRSDLLDGMGQAVQIKDFIKFE